MEGREKNRTQFSQPFGITCDSAGIVYVADSGNDRVQVFTAKGKFLRMHGKNRGELSYPIGTAFNPSSKHVYISDSENPHISVFTCEGQFVTSLSAYVAERRLAIDNVCVRFL